MKPSGVPDEAFWDDDAWAAGSKDEHGRKIGLWRYWRESGELWCEEEWGDATHHLAYKRFHRDGSLSQSGEKNLARDIWVGVMRWLKTGAPSDEDRFFPAMHPNVRVFEVFFDDEGFKTTERGLDAEGKQLSVSTGAPLPERPTGVHEDALLADNDQVWMLCRRKSSTNMAVGDVLLWDRKGRLTGKRSYDLEHKLVEQLDYENGRLRKSIRKEPDGTTVTSYYHRDIDPPRVRETAVSRRNGADQETTRFDRGGERIQTTRVEKVTPHHVRHYDDGRLVFESIRSESPNQPPLKVEYYDYEGKVVLRYLSNRDGTGIWKLGQEELPEAKEEDCNKYDLWTRFVPGLMHYEGEERVNFPAKVRERFSQLHQEEVLDAALAKLTPAKELAAALGNDSWAKVDSALTGAEELPQWIMGALEDDERLACHSLDSIRLEIEHQGTLYESTYRVATVLARMLPHQVDRPAVERRVFDFLHDVLALDGIDGDPKAFGALCQAFEPALPRLEDWATHNKDKKLANEAQFVLARIGHRIAQAQRPATKAAPKKAATKKTVTKKTATQKTATKKSTTKKTTTKRPSRKVH